MNKSLEALGNIKIDNYNLWQNDATDKNNSSYVLSIQMSKRSYLLMGDADKEIENKIMKHFRNIKHDVIKVGHHGSSSSTSEKFLKEVNPSAAVISCGKNNKYGHPSKEVIDLLNKYDIEIYRTDERGTIKFYY